MTRPVFGQREAKAIAFEHSRLLKDHANYRENAAKTGRRPRRAMRLLGWLSFCIAGFAATLVYASEGIAAVVAGVSKALPL